MSTKIVYFSVGGREEKAEFRTEDLKENVLEIFRSAAEAGPQDILKLYSPNGHLLCITPKLLENTPDTKYTLEVVATDIQGQSLQLTQKLSGLEDKVCNLERRLTGSSPTVPEEVQDLKRRVNYLAEKLEYVSHLSWLGLHKDMSEKAALQPFWHKSNIKLPEEQIQQVIKKFSEISSTHFSNDVLERLQQATFDNWQWDPAEQLLLIQHMYLRFNLLSKFSISSTTLNNFLVTVYRNYNSVPFHNFTHCFTVTQMIYALIHITKVHEHISDLELLYLITSAICHDLDHPGFNNSYQVNAQTELALRYNDVSPLENHHCSTAFHILRNPDCNIFQNLDPDQFKQVRSGMINCILATDMARHNEILAKFKEFSPSFNITRKDHRDVLFQVMIKVADVSNEARPVDVSERWLDKLLAEYFHQGDTEKLEGLPVAPFMDREKVTKPSAQIGFIKFVLLPLFESLAAVYASVKEAVVQPVQTALDYYQQMQVELDEKKKKEDEERAAKLEQYQMGRNGMKSQKS